MIRRFPLTMRTVFPTDPQGRIAKTCRDTDPKTNSGELLADLSTPKKAAS